MQTPVAAVPSTGDELITVLMLEHLELDATAKRIEDAVTAELSQRSGAYYLRSGDAIAARVAR